MYINIDICLSKCLRQRPHRALEWGVIGRGSLRFAFTLFLSGTKGCFPSLVVLPFPLHFSVSPAVLRSMIFFSLYKIRQKRWCCFMALWVQQHWLLPSPFFLFFLSFCKGGELLSLFPFCLYVGAGPSDDGDRLFRSQRLEV